MRAAASTSSAASPSTSSTSRCERAAKPSISPISPYDRKDEGKPALDLAAHVYLLVLQRGGRDRTPSDSRQPGRHDDLSGCAAVLRPHPTTRQAPRAQANRAGQISPPNQMEFLRRAGPTEGSHAGSGRR